MKRFAVYISAITTLICTAWAGEDNTNHLLRLELSLADGSRIIGTPAIKSIPVQTSYAKMDVPLKHILTIKIGEDHETCKHS